mmetsp:Transcript_20183/g.42267  ORF Transcript_20183/g.42267 Transcript_20183/m.42267 type:complete len:223 (+) Transcript_20183:124-792(+)
MTLSHVLVYTINLNHTARVRRPVTAVVGAVMLGHTGAKVAITRCFFALRPAFETLAPSHGRVVDDLAPIVAAHLLGFVAVNLFLAGPTFVDAAFFLALADISLGFMIPGTTTCIPDATRGSITPTTVASNIVVAHVAVTCLTASLARAGNAPFHVSASSLVPVAARSAGALVPITALARVGAAAGSARAGFFGIFFFGRFPNAIVGSAAGLVTGAEVASPEV